MKRLLPMFFLFNVLFSSPVFSMDVLANFLFGLGGMPWGHVELLERDRLEPVAVERPVEIVGRELNCSMSSASWEVFKALTADPAEEFIPMVRQDVVCFIFQCFANGPAAELEAPPVIGKIFDFCIDAAIRRNGVVWIDGTMRVWVVFHGHRLDDAIRSNVVAFWDACAANLSAIVGDASLCIAPAAFHENVVFCKKPGRGSGMNMIGRFTSAASSFLYEDAEAAVKGSDVPVSFYPFPLVDADPMVNFNTMGYGELRDALMSLPLAGLPPVFC